MLSVSLSYILLLSPAPLCCILILRYSKLQKGLCNEKTIHLLRNGVKMKYSQSNLKRGERAAIAIGVNR